MGFVHIETVTMKRLYLQSYFDIIYLAFVVGPTGLRLTCPRRVLPMVGRRHFCWLTLYVIAV